MYGMTMDGGPIVADGKIIFGFAGCANPYQGGCYILALDAKTGQEAWRFWSIARPGTPGGDSWNGAPWKDRYGADSWFPGSYDPNLNIVYFGTGNTYNIQQLLRPQARKGESNDARWTESTLALDARTGKLVWGYQHLAGDVWDLDWTFEQTLVTLPVNGVMRQLNVSAGKMGIFDALDRANGQYVFSKSLDLENIIIGIDPKTGKKIINPAMRVSPDTLAYPANLCSWARDEPNTAFDPTTDILYVPVLLNSCPDKGDDPYGSRLEALNLATQKVVWIQRHYSQEMTSLLVTAGGVVFDGSDDRYFRASDSATGSLLWQTRLDSIPKSSPVTYSVDGTQYVAVVAANRAPPAAAAQTSDVDAAGETLWVFKLNR
jgi:alcohol dehydrogenase (cytochrome c)